MIKVFRILFLLVLSLFLVAQGFADTKTTKADVLKKLNERLAANKSPYQVLDFADASFEQGVIKYKGTASFPAENQDQPDENDRLFRGEQENNGSDTFSTTFSVAEQKKSSTNWHVEGSLEVGYSVSAKVEASIPGVAKAETSSTGSVKLTVGAGGGGAEETTSDWKQSWTVNIQPNTIKRWIAYIKHNESSKVDFSIPMYAVGEYKVVARDLVKLYRFYKAPDHFYTTAEHEGFAAQYAAEGVTCLLYSKAYPDTVVLHRFFNGKVGDHFYTINKSEGDGAKGYAYEGPVGWVYSPTKSKTGLVDLHRFFNGKSGDHLYTLDRNEGAKAGYAYEGVACRVYASDFREKIKIEDDEMLPRPEDRVFEVTGTAFAAQEVITGFKVYESQIPAAGVSASTTVDKNTTKPVKNQKAVKASYKDFKDLEKLVQEGKAKKSELK